MKLLNRILSLDLSRIKKNFSIVFSLLVLILVSGCSKDVKKTGDSPLVYTSFYPVNDLTKMIGGDTINVKSFMPLDKDPHIWEPSPKDMKKLASCDLLVVNGANMEPWLDTVRENLPNLDILKLSDSVDLITYKGAAAIGDFQYLSRIEIEAGKNKIDFGHTHEDMMRVAFIKDEGLNQKDLVKKAKEIMSQKGELVAQKSTNKVEEGKVYGVEMGHESGEVFFDFPESGKWIFISDRISEDLLPYNLMDSKGNILKDEGKEESLMEGSSSGFDKITYDPHSWLSIVNAKKYLNAIQEKLIEKYPENERLYKKNKLKYVDQLTDIDAEYKEKFSKLDKARKNFLTLHYAYAYIARDFDLTQYPLQGLTSLESPSLKTIKKAIDFSNYYHISTVFYEYGQNPKQAKALAEEIGGKVSPLASMEFLSKEQKDKDQNYIDLMRMNLENLYNSMVEEEK
ncbi:metal ABC transporter substrate-binding protein [Anaerococcus sp. NML200537]|uniref:metal ABC transporter substrate-binding protein n=1 Tax=Anaerococcus sp. NML200537 TaxID=2954485 RepID=UPI002237A1F1|nr:metal ABC transporter substrate-binding protein [Anaerococcus sp. NML200537]MCW6702260.1 metal ABC transporter substrate-binding protein [Anaerococcus sp. NML200537]